MELNKIYHGDAFDILKEIKDESIDLILTDPPYGIANDAKITRGKNTMKFKGKDITHDFGEWDKFNNLEEFNKFTFKWVDECVRVLRKGGMFISYFDRDKINFLSLYLQSKDFKTKGYKFKRL